MKLQALILAIFSSLLFITSCTISDGPVGSKSRPFTMYFIPSVDASKVAYTADKIAEFVSKEVSKELYKKPTGFYVKASIPTDYITVVESLGSKKADFVVVSAFPYLLARDARKYPIEPAFTLARENGATYRAMIIVHADSKIKTLKDLNGKKFAFTDPSSTSGYIVPSQMLRSAKIKLGPTVFAQKHDNVVTMVYQRQVQAGAAYYSPRRMTKLNGKMVHAIGDARFRVITQFPDVEKKVKILTLSPPIPNEVWAFRGDLYKDLEKNKRVKKSIKTALIAFSKTKKGYAVLSDLYDFRKLVHTKDSDYDNLRKMIKDSGTNLGNLVK